MEEHKIRSEIAKKIAKYDKLGAQYFKGRVLSDFSDLHIELEDGCTLVKRGRAYFLRAKYTSDIQDYLRRVPFFGDKNDVKNLVSRLNSSKYMNQEYVPFCSEFKTLPKEDLLRLCTAMAGRIDRLQAYIRKVQEVVDSSINSF